MSNKNKSNLDNLQSTQQPSTLSKSPQQSNIEPKVTQQWSMSKINELIQHKSPSNTLAMDSETVIQLSSPSNPKKKTTPK